MPIGPAKRIIIQSALARWARGENAVTTPDLKVRGMDGLRVVDASVMPFVPSCNTNAPTIMVAEKASDAVLGRKPLPVAAF